MYILKIGNSLLADFISCLNLSISEENEKQVLNNVTNQERYKFTRRVSEVVTSKSSSKYSSFIIMMFYALVLFSDIVLYVYVYICYGGFFV